MTTETAQTFDPALKATAWAFVRAPRVKSQEANRIWLAASKRWGRAWVWAVQEARGR